MKSNSILITEPASPIGGINSVVDNLLPYFKEKVIVAYRGPRDGKKGVKYANKINAFILPIYDLICYVIKILFHDPQSIIVNTSINKRSVFRDGYYVRISRFLNKSVLVFVHGYEERVLKEEIDVIKKGILQAQGFVVLSEEIKIKLKGLTDKNISVLYNSVEDSFSKAFDDSFVASKTHLFNNEGSINILFLSRIVKEKGVYVAIDAYNRVKTDNDSISLTIAGDGDELKNVKQYVKTNTIKDVCFLGNVVGESKIDAFRSASIFLFPSFNEGLPVVVLEAMQAGIPVITTAVGGLTDLFKMHKFGKLLICPTVMETSNALLRILSEDIITIGQSNHFFASKHFSPRLIAEQIDAILENLD